MRDVDRRVRFSRRSFLRTTAAAAPAAALAVTGLTISATAAWAQEAKSLSPHTMATLARMARDIYPHDRIADIYYIKAVGPWDAKAGQDPPTKAMLEQGVALLDGNAQVAHGSAYLDLPWEEQRVALLRAIETSVFFQKIRGDLVVSFYNQHELWPKFGYEGASADKGGYIHRGFNDIDWLPQS